MDILEVNESIISSVRGNVPQTISIKLRSSNCDAAEQCALLCTALESNIVTRSLDFSFVVIGDAVCTELFKLLLSNTALQIIKLRGCKITDVGCLQIIEGIRHSRAPLRLIDLASNLLTNSSAEAIEKALEEHAARRSYAGFSLQVLLSGNSISEELCSKLQLKSPVPSPHRAGSSVHFVRLALLSQASACGALICCVNRVLSSLAARSASEAHGSRYIPNRPSPPSHQQHLPATAATAAAIAAVAPTPRP